MTAKQYLRQGYRLNELIKTHQDELEQLHRMVGSIQSPGFDKPGGAHQWNGTTAEQGLVIRPLTLRPRSRRRSPRW